MISKLKIVRECLEIEISTHAILRAFERGIHRDMIIATIKGGRIERFGKNRIKFVKDYKIGKVICLDEKKGPNRIEIVTVEVG